MGIMCYRYNGKEFSEELGHYFYGFRMYDPAIARFTCVDPISDKFPHVSVYNYAENEPVGSIDLHGLQRLRVNDVIRDYDVSSFKKNVTQAGVAAYYPRQAMRLGDGEKPYSTKLAKTVARISRHAANKGNTLSQGRGSQQNAFRHALLNSSMTKEFGEEVATVFANAHEGVDIDETLSVDWNLPFEGDRNYADAVADVLNNEIGRDIGKENGSADILEMGLMIGTEFQQNGLFTVSEDDKGNFSITRTKISHDQWMGIITNLLGLNNQGFNSQEAAEKKKKDGQ